METNESSLIVDRERPLDLSLELYAVYDTVAEECGPIFQAKNDAVATRQFRDLMSKTKCPADYQMLRLATFFVWRPRIVPLDLPVVVCEGAIIIEED